MAFENLVGNSKVKELLTNAIKSNNILHSYLFVGIDGIGKSLFAKEFANMILCTSDGGKPCQKCKSCLEFAGESHPDFLQVEPEDGKTIKIEQIRYLQEKIAEKPVTSERKVYIINKCDSMTREASNALLKTLEEPPSYATIILITSNESKLLVTIKSRCTKIAFTPLSEEDIKTYLQNELDENIKAKNADMNDNMIIQCQGSIGRLLRILEEKETYAEIEKIITNLERTDITQIWQKSDVLYQSKDNILDLLDYMNVIFYEKLRSKQDIKYAKAVSIVEEAKKRIIANANYDMSIDNMLLKLCEKLV